VFLARMAEPFVAHGSGFRHSAFGLVCFSGRRFIRRKGRRSGCVRIVSECDAFKRLRLGSSEKQIPQVDENTEESKSPWEPLESVGRRLRQARQPSEVLCLQHL
jgi:hypothetical protein